MIRDFVELFHGRLAVTRFRMASSTGRRARQGTYVSAVLPKVSSKIGEDVMHAVIRSYSGKGAKELLGVIEKNKAEVEKVVRSIKGFVSWSLVRTSDGGFTVSVYQDKAGADESVRAAREWISKNASNTGASAPTVSEGPVVLHLK